MRKILNILLGFILIFGFVYLVGINIVNIIYYKLLQWTFDFRLLFFNNQGQYFFILTLIALLLWSNVIYAQLFRDKKNGKGRTKKDDTEASHIATDKETQKFLTCLKFDSEKLKEESVGKRAGLPIVTKKNRVWVNGGDEHSLVIGTSGSGKSWSLVLEYIELCRLTGENMIITDPKGELALATKDKLEKDGYEVIILNFVEPEYSNGWNPLEKVKLEWIKAEEKFKTTSDKKKQFYRDHGIVFSDSGDQDMEMRPDYSKAIELLRDIADTLCLDTNAKDPFWNESARDLIVGGACFLLENEATRDSFNFLNIKNVFDMEVETLDKIVRENPTRYYNTLNNLGAYLKAPDNTRQSIYSTFKNKMATVTLNDGISRILANNHIDFAKLNDTRTTIFLVIHDEKKTYHSLATMFVKQTYESLIELARKNESLRLKIPMNFILDEFGNMPRLKDVDTMLTAARSRGIRLTMIVQDLQQLNEKYGKQTATTIKGNVMLTCYLLSGANETLKEISDLAGKKWSFNKDTDKWELIPCFPVDRLKYFQQGEALFLFQRRYPYYTKLLGYDKYLFYDLEATGGFKLVNKDNVKEYRFNEIYKIPKLRRSINAQSR